MLIRPLEPPDAEQAGHDASWIGPSGGEVHQVGLWEGGALVGAVRLAPMRRIRRGHAAEVQLRCRTAEQADALLQAVCSFADAWTPCDRLELALPSDHSGTAVAARHGFVLEVRQVDRYGDGRDELLFGRLRPGFVPRPPGPPPPWPSRHHRVVETVSFRPIELEDAAALRDLSIEPTAVWGTLQTPWSNERYYADRHQATAPGNDLFAVLADGAFAGTGGLHPTGLPDVLVLGMALSPAWQGCGLGARLIDHLIARAWERGARRIELGVWEDNTRARALYASRGFVAEGTLRFHSIRAGGHASSLEMALTRART